MKGTGELFKGLGTVSKSLSTSPTDLAVRGLINTIIVTTSTLLDMEALSRVKLIST
jgi:hypothetical protein